MENKPFYRLIALNCRYTHSCPALFYVRNGLERNLPEAGIDLLQLTINDPYYQVLLRLSEGEPDVLFFSAYIWNAGYLRRLLVDLARIRPGKPMVIGGPQAGFLNDLPPECTLVMGEIEGIDPAFYQDLARGDLQPLYQADAGAVFPFPYQPSDFTGHLQYRQILYESSRGCPFSCSYCLSAVGTRVVHKNVSTVQAELEQILAARPPLIKFVDRTFNDNPERALAIWHFLPEIGVGTRFHFEVAPDRFTDEMIDFLTTVPIGLFQFEIGIQSTNRKTLTAVNRRMDVERALSTIRRLRAAENIHLHVDLILGLPEDNRQSFSDSFRHVFSGRPHHIQMGLLKVLPGTPIADDVEKYKLQHCAQPPYEVLSTGTMDHRQLAELYLFCECVERFHNNRYFPSIWHYLTEKEEDAFAFFFDLLTLCKKRGFFQRAATQELMNDLLVEHTADRNDATLIKELLCYDWLRCGHRFLPRCLSRESLSAVRNRLRKIMPQNFTPLYSAKERNLFFKQGIFFPFSVAALEVVGLRKGDHPMIVCFLKKSDFCLHELRQTALLPGIVSEFI
jgi:radical SAM superfamily enzyme YgiQ (UPF0313 family)